GTTFGCGLSLPQAAWSDIAQANRGGDPVHLRVRATVDGSCVSTSTSTVDLSLADQDLTGGLYYWQSSAPSPSGREGQTGGIYAYDFGSPKTSATPFFTPDSAGHCQGCHALSRDGMRMAVMSDELDGDDEFGEPHVQVLDMATRTVLGGVNL